MSERPNRTQRWAGRRYRSRGSWMRGTGRSVSSPHPPYPPLNRSLSLSCHTQANGSRILLPCMELKTGAKFSTLNHLFWILDKDLECLLTTQDQACAQIGLYLCRTHAPLPSHLPSAFLGGSIPFFYKQLLLFWTHCPQVVVTLSSSPRNASVIRIFQKLSETAQECTSVCTCTVRTYVYTLCSR